MSHGFASRTSAYVQTKDRVCSRKLKFKSEAAAESEVRRAHAGDPRIQVYECPWCHGFHVGHGKIQKEDSDLNVTQYG